MLQKFKILSLVSFFIFMVSGSVPAQIIFSTSTGSISFVSEAPLEMIKASSQEMRGKIDPVRKMFAFSIKTASFKGFNSPLQKEHYNENYLETHKFPDATFSGKIIEDIDFTKDGTYTVRAKGNLFIHGVSRERIIKSTIIISNGRLSLRSAFTVLLSDHSIPIPKVVNEKLASEIKVDVQADLKPNEP